MGGINCRLRALSRTIFNGALTTAASRCACAAGRPTSTAARRSRSRTTTSATPRERPHARGAAPAEDHQRDEVARSPGRASSAGRSCPWNAPKTLKTDMLGYAIGTALSGSAQTEILKLRAASRCPARRRRPRRTLRSRRRQGLSPELVLLRRGLRGRRRVRLLGLGLLVRGRRCPRPWTWTPSVAPVLGRALELAIAPPRPVVGVVEALALEVHRDRVEDALDRRVERVQLSTGSSVILCMTSNWWPRSQRYS